MYSHVMRMNSGVYPDCPFEVNKQIDVLSSVPVVRVLVGVVSTCVCRRERTR